MQHLIAFYVRFSTFPPNLVRIDPIVKKWQHIFESQNGDGRHLECLVNMHFRSDSCVFCQILNISIKFGEDWPYGNEMATDFRNSRWRPPPSWIFVNMHFWCNSYFYIRVSTFPPHLMRIGPLFGKWQPIFETQDGGGRHLEKYTSGWTAIMRKEPLVCSGTQPKSVLSRDENGILYS